MQKIKKIAGGTNKLLKKIDNNGLPSREEQDEQPKTWWGGFLALLGLLAVTAYAIYSIIQFENEWPTITTSVTLTNTNTNETSLDISNFYYFFQAEDGSCLNSNEVTSEGVLPQIVNPIMAPVPGYTPSYPIYVNSINSGGSAGTTNYKESLSYSYNLCTASRIQVTLSFLKTISFDSSAGTIQAASSWYNFNFYLNNNEITFMTVTLTPQTFWQFSKSNPLESPNMTINYEASVTSSNAWVYSSCSSSTGFTVNFYLAEEQEIINVAYDTTLLDIFGKIGGIYTSLVGAVAIVYKLIYSRKSIGSFIQCVFCCGCCCRCCKKGKKTKLTPIQGEPSTAREPNSAEIMIPTKAL